MSAKESRFTRLWLDQIREAFDGTWSEHSGSLADRLSKAYPDLVHIEPSPSFYKHMWTPEGLHTLLEGYDPDYDDVISMHLWAHLWWSKKRTEFSRFHGDLLTEDYIRQKDTTYNVVARRFLP